MCWGRAAQQAAPHGRGQTGLPAQITGRVYTRSETVLHRQIKYRASRRLLATMDAAMLISSLLY